MEKIRTWFLILIYAPRLFIMLIYDKFKPQKQLTKHQNIKIGNILFPLKAKSLDDKTLEPYMISLLNQTNEPITKYLIEKFLKIARKHHGHI